MTHMQSRTRRVREHVEHVEFLFLLVFSHLVGFVFHPLALPFLFNFVEVILHCYIVFLLFSFAKII